MCQGEETSLNTTQEPATEPAPVLEDFQQQHPSTALPEGTAALLSQSPCPFMLRRGGPAQGRASVSAAASIIPRVLAQLGQRSGLRVCQLRVLPML